MRPRTRRRGIGKIPFSARGTRAGTICEFMVKYGQMKHLASITVLILPACEYVSTGVAVPPPSDFVDTEAVTNVVFDAGEESTVCTTQMM